MFFFFQLQWGEDGSVFTWGNPAQGGDSEAVQHLLRNIRSLGEKLWEFQLCMFFPWKMPSIFNERALFAGNVGRNWWDKVGKNTQIDVEDVTFNLGH